MGSTQSSFPSWKKIFSYANNNEVRYSGALYSICTQNLLTWRWTLSFITCSKFKVQNGTELRRRTSTLSFITCSKFKVQNRTELRRRTSSRDVTFYKSQIWFSLTCQNKISQSLHDFFTCVSARKALPIPSLGPLMCHNMKNSKAHVLKHQLW